MTPSANVRIQRFIKITLFANKLKSLIIYQIDIWKYLSSGLQVLEVKGVDHRVLGARSEGIHLLASLTPIKLKPSGKDWERPGRWNSIYCSSQDRTRSCWRETLQIRSTKSISDHRLGTLCCSSQLTQLFLTDLFLWKGTWVFAFAFHNAEGFQNTWKWLKADREGTERIWNRGFVQVAWREEEISGLKIKAAINGKSWHWKQNG